MNTGWLGGQAIKRLGDLIPQALDMFVAKPQTDGNNGHNDAIEEANMIWNELTYEERQKAGIK